MSTFLFEWPMLVEAALLGTARRTPDLTPLATELGLSGEGSTPESRLLELAALATNYRWAGDEPARLPLPPLPVCLPETQAYMPDAALRILDQLLADKEPNRRLVGQWTRKCRERGWILPPDRLTTLLSRRKQGEFEVDPVEVKAIMGNRGVWLGQFNPDWAFEPDLTPEEEWHEGRRTVRDLALYAIRKTDPARALALLAQTWPTESLKERKSLLNTMLPGLSAADIPFLEGVRAELVSVKKPKPLQTEMLMHVTELLLAIPESGLVAEVVGQLRAYFKTPTGLLNKLMQKIDKRLELPTRFDHFLEPKYIESFGFDALESHTEAERISSWFVSLLMRLHPAVWPLLLDDPQTRPVPFLMRQAIFKDEHEVVLRVLEEIVVNFKRADWVADLLPYKKDVQNWPKLLALLPADEQQTLILKEFSLTGQLGEHQYLTAEEAAPWSLPFSEAIWTNLGESWMKSPYQPLHGAERQFFRDAVAVVHPQLTPKAEALLLPHIPEAHQHACREKLINPFLRWLDLREQIENL